MINIIRRLSAVGRGQLEFRGIHGIDEGPDSTLYVSDLFRVQIISQSLAHYVGEIGEIPFLVRGLCIDKKRGLLIVTAEQGRVYDMNSHSLLSDQGSLGEFSLPAGLISEDVAVDNDFIYVASAGIPPKLDVYSAADRSLVQSTVEIDTPAFPRNLTPSLCIAINSKGHLIISYSTMNVVKVFAPPPGGFSKTSPAAPKLLLTIGNPGSTDYFNTVCGVAVDSHDNIFICDVLRSRVQVHDSKGKFIHSIPVPGKPRHLKVVSDGSLFVVSRSDEGHDSIYAF